MMQFCTSFGPFQDTMETLGQVLYYIISINILVLNERKHEAFLTVDLIFQNPFDLNSYPIFVNSINSVLTCSETVPCFIFFLVSGTSSLYEWT